MKLARIWLPSLGAIVLSVISMQCIAAQGLEEIIVTAQKRAEPLQTVPIAVSAFSSDTMKDMGITSSQDLQLAVPSLVFPALGNLGQVYLRGVGTRFTLNGLDPSVATYIGERYSPRGSGAIFSLGPDVERVEVLKGPQGVLFGRNATGGAIRIIKKAVDDEFNGYAKAGIGNYGYYTAEGTVNVPLSDTFGVRLSGQVEKRDGYLKNIAAGIETELGPIPDRNENLDRTQLNAHFRWKMNDTSEANLYIDYWRQNELAGATNALGPANLNRGILFGGIFVPNGDFEHTATDATQPNKGDETGYELNLKFGFHSFDLVSITTYADFFMNWNSEGDGSSAQIFDPATAYDQSKTWSQEMRLVSNTDGPLSWQLGAFYYDDNHSQEFIFYAKDFPVLFHASNGKQTVKTKSWAGYGHLKYEFAKNWAVTAGVRFTYDKRDAVIDVSKRTNLAYVTLGAAIMPFTFSKHWSEVTPQLTLEYNFDNAMVYATYARGYKAGGVNYPLYTTPNGVDPETLDSYEIGMKSEFLDRSLRLNVSAFYYDYKDLQVQRPAATGSSTTIENASNAKVVGLDVDATWVPTDAFTLRLGLSKLDSEYKDYTAIGQVLNARLDGTLGTANPTPGASGVQFDASGRTLLHAPNYSWYATAAYKFKAGRGTMPLSVTYSWKDDTTFDFPIDPLLGQYLVQGSYGLLSARLSYMSHDGRYEISLWGRNLTNEKYYNEIAANAQGLRGAPAILRTYGLDFEVHF